MHNYCTKNLKERSFEGAIYEFNNTLASQTEEAAHHMLTITVVVTNAHDSGAAASAANCNFIVLIFDDAQNSR